MLVELNKVNAPSLLLEDYNYFINKAVNQYINKRYILYDTTQQTTDDLRVLKATATIPCHKINKHYGILTDDNEDNVSLFNDGDMFGATYELELPKDYLHMLNCTCVYYVAKPYKCYPAGKYWTRPATRLTADAWAVILDNAYMCPTYRRPYYYIHNVNLQLDLPTNPYDGSLGTTDLYNIQNIRIDKNTKEELLSKEEPGKHYRRVVDLTEPTELGNRLIGNDLVDRTTYSRTPNPTSIRCEIRYGKDTEVFQLRYALVDYIKAPLHIKLTQEQIDLTIDRSQVLEFSDNVCQEIINELVHLVMENASDLRISTHQAVTTSIAGPTQQQAQQQQNK